MQTKTNKVVLEEASVQPIFPPLHIGDYGGWGAWGITCSIYTLHDLWSRGRSASNRCLGFRI